MKRTKQPEALIRLLLDKGAEFGDRDDAAMDLAGFDDPEAEEALTTVAQDLADDEDIVDRAGESLAEIWKRKGKWDSGIVAQMHPESRKFFNWK
jgi:hypothetical protein